MSIIEDTKCADELFALGAQQFIDGLKEEAAQWRRLSTEIAEATRKLNASIGELAATRRQLFGAE